MTSLARADFERLYLNANSIAEIAFLRAIDKAAAAPPRTPQQQAATDAFLADVANPDPATFDWSALEGVYGFDGPLDAAPPTPMPTAAAAADEPVRLPGFDEMVGFDDDEDLDAPVDVGRYLERVEQARPLLQPRVDDCFARADLPALAAALHALPVDRPPLTSPLTPAAFEQWLALYESGDAAMEAAVLGIRRLEPLLQA